MEDLVRRWTRVAAVAVGAWASCMALLWAAEGLHLALQWGAPAAAVLVLLMAFVRPSLHLNRRETGGAVLPDLGAANLLTLSRGWAAAALAGFLLPPPPPAQVAWLLVTLFLYVALGDILDGHWARASGRETLLGKRLDGMVDALAMLVAVALAVRWGRLPPWCLALGLAPYLFAFAVALRRRLGKPSPPLSYRPSRRLTGALLYGFVAVALSPLFAKATLAWASLPVGALVLASFLADWRAVATPGPLWGRPPFRRKGEPPH